MQNKQRGLVHDRIHESKELFSIQSGGCQQNTEIRSEKWGGLDASKGCLEFKV